MREVIIKHFVIPVLGLMVVGIPVVCAYWWNDFVTKKEYDQMEVEKEVAVDHVAKYDSLFKVSEAHSERLERKLQEQNKLINDYIKKDKELTEEAIVVLEDTLYNKHELDSILINLRHGSN